MMTPILKYNLKDRGAKLESENPIKAIDYYNDLKGHEYFANDYFPYRRLVLMHEKVGDDESKASVIREFFRAKIHCNCHNYLWFKYKLEDLKDKGLTTQAEIDMLTDYFKQNSLKNKSIANTPLPIADRIRKRNGRVIVESQKSYDRREKQYEYDVRLSHLNRQRKYDEYIALLNHMIDDEGYRRYVYFKRLCIAYRKVDDSEKELEVIERYFRGESTRTKASDRWFKHRLDELKAPEVIIDISGMDLSRNPFFEYSRKLDTTENLKRKCALIEYGRRLEGADAIAYYKYLSSNTYFKNDWYPYHRLSEIYNETGDDNANLVNIKKLLQSKIYLNEYQFLWFSDRIRVLMDKTSTPEETVQRWLDDYEIHGSTNRFRLNKYLADRFVSDKGKFTLLKDSEFDHIQERLALRERGCIYERVGNYDLAITHYVKIINEREFNYAEFHMRLWDCLFKIGDFKRLRKAMALYRSSPPSDRSDESDGHFAKLLSEVEETL
jgi:hypothetical protein